MHLPHRAFNSPFAPLTTFDSGQAKRVLMYWENRQNHDYSKIPGNYGDIFLAVNMISPIFRTFPSTLVPFLLIRNHLVMSHDTKRRKDRKTWEVNIIRFIGNGQVALCKLAYPNKSSPWLCFSKDAWGLLQLQDDGRGC